MARRIERRIAVLKEFKEIEVAMFRERIWFSWLNWFGIRIDLLRYYG